MNTTPMFSSASDEWATPNALFELCDREVRRHDPADYGFCLDAAASAETAKVGPYIGPDHDDPAYRDALTAPWGQPDVKSIAWLNPPYSAISEFMARAVNQAQRNGVETWALIPARTDTRWWWNYVLRADEIRFLKGRLKFLSDGKEMGSAPFPSAIAIFRADYDRLHLNSLTWFWDWKAAAANDLKAAA